VAGTAGVCGELEVREAGWVLSRLLAVETCNNQQEPEARSVGNARKNMHRVVVSTSQNEKPSGELEKEENWEIEEFPWPETTERTKKS